MNAFIRMFRSLGTVQLTDTGFESYYGAVIRRQPTGGPTAAEARRDFKDVRRTQERVVIL
jgi:hypothetical protein